MKAAVGTRKRSKQATRIDIITQWVANATIDNKKFQSRANADKEISHKRAMKHHFSYCFLLFAVNYPFFLDYISVTNITCIDIHRRSV
jgi:uncharacterized protein YdaL